MKKTVVDIYDLQEMIPFFKSKFGTFLGKIFIKLFCVEKVNNVHENSCHLRGSAFTSAILSDPLINIKYKVHNEEVLDKLPEGAFVTVSNHPIGSLDGIILIDIFAARRPDFKVMVNGVLTKIGAMGDNFISVTPDSNNQGANPQNINGVRLSLAHLHGGHPVGFFPAGAISFYRKDEKRICDLPWTHSVIRLIRKAKVPVIPVCFDFLNSKYFYWLGKIDWRIRTLRIPAEAFNKKGKTFDVYLGDPIPAEKIQAISDDEELAEFLYRKTYSAKKQA
ncbi:putative hemolysin [Parabacteroides sp. PF5-5]|uniref:lysophospholipid acyltransferase family protein n=1 Tax=unclassified Parabacteroides TaxID=2649774 RepID=UPI0024757B3D|nr:MULTISPECIES: lysophospholipid acyltransferase family protein [unclassified Parabacteroides]MDH6305616.1 putative hemolysin [Parabacteroides sp. PH5-39]MDH6316346.1 putative hemolysin [Parabacteroides sp. PF5-13]MDH6319829.1 putative hemolysin [Parabacteroides sp. PH5-13]MDH6323580.1 putative hemolysin [Parabacteroides sp. PH5-8]MDH6327533.1 putative hemolysin [Parabacteroides sp. PH5-41]